MMYLDADACPVKDQVFKVAARYEAALTIVANAPLRLPSLPGLRAKMEMVPGSPDAADDWIAARAGPNDLVLTADIPLAARVLATGARCLDFRGGEFRPEAVGNALASRDLKAHLRGMGLMTGGPAIFSARDRSKFASALDAAVSRLVREHPPVKSSIGAE